MNGERLHLQRPGLAIVAGVGAREELVPVGIDGEGIIAGLEPGEFRQTNPSGFGTGRRSAAVPIPSGTAGSVGALLRRRLSM